VNYALSPLWNLSPPLPQVRASLLVHADALEVHWEVRDFPATFRSEVLCDGGAVWQDSCVEIFVEALDGSGDYCNFEFNSRGCCLAARGPCRENRREFTAEEYALIWRRPVSVVSEEAGIYWGLEARIPGSLLGASGDLRECGLRGNIYKCGDKTHLPHYLAVFPVSTEKPDFHRPEYFGRFA
jgi:hypothetical protein